MQRLKILGEKSQSGERNRLLIRQEFHKWHQTWLIVCTKSDRGCVIALQKQTSQLILLHFGTELPFNSGKISITPPYRSAYTALSLQKLLLSLWREQNQHGVHPETIVIEPVPGECSQKGMHDVQQHDDVTHPFGLVTMQAD